MGSDCTKAAVTMQFFQVIKKNGAVVREFTDGGGDPFILDLGGRGTKCQTISSISSQKHVCTLSCFSVAR